MKSLLLSIFVLLCFYSFGQDTISKSTNQKIKTDSKSNQGAVDRPIFSNSYYGSGKGTDNKAWTLSGRRLLSQGEVKAECNYEGTVVVEVKVNKNGSITNAKFSPSGSNTTSKCLQEAAIKSAYKYKWNEDSNAPDGQIGFIVFNFRNGE